MNLLHQLTAYLLQPTLDRLRTLASGYDEFLDRRLSRIADLITQSPPIIATVMVIGTVGEGEGRQLVVSKRAVLEGNGNAAVELDTYWAMRKVQILTIVDERLEVRCITIGSELISGSPLALVERWDPGPRLRVTFEKARTVHR